LEPFYQLQTWHGQAHTLPARAKPCPPSEWRCGANL